MEQRTCNIIMCCKGHCELVDEKASQLDAIAAYMSKECACPKEDYKGRLMESILREALFDYISGADNPGFELRELLREYPYSCPNPSLSERICSMFALTDVRNGDGYVNGFTNAQIKQSEKDLGSVDAGVVCLFDESKVVPYPCSRACALFGDCVTRWHNRRMS